MKLRVRARVRYVRSHEAPDTLTINDLDEKMRLLELSAKSHPGYAPYWSHQEDSSLPPFTT